MAQEGTTPLMECAGSGSAADVRALIAAGADVNARDHVGRTVLDYARTAGVVAYLRAQGAHSGKKLILESASLCQPLIAFGN